MFDWEEYSSDSGTEDVPLLLSVQGQALIIAAMDALRWRENWLEVDDTTWDTIDDAVGQAHYQIMEEQTLTAENAAFTVERTTSSFVLAFGAWQPIPVLLGQNPDNAITFPTGFIKITDGGLWRVNLVLSVRNAATNASTKLVTLKNRTQGTRPCIGVPMNVAASGIVRHWNALNDIFLCNAGDEFEFEIFSTLSDATVESAGTIGSVVSRCLLAEFTRVRL